MTTRLRALARILLPNACVSCETLVSPAHPDALVCGVCLARLRPLAGGCGRCRQPLPPVGPCRFCASWVGELGAAHSAVWLEREAREIMHHLKYDDLPALGAAAAGVIAQRVPRPSGTLLPVPLSPRRMRTRGYNQAAAIARGLAARWQLPIDEQALRRVRENPSQISLTPAARLANVAEAFHAGPPADSGSAAAAVVVDDVLTTGATLSAAAAALARAGWTPIVAVTFARALPFELRVLTGPDLTNLQTR